MAPLRVIFFLATLLLFVPPAASHGEPGAGLPHVNPVDLNIEPGQSVQVDLLNSEGGFTSTGGREGRFPAGWIFTMSGAVLHGNGTVVVELRTEESLVDTLTFPPGNMTVTRTALMTEWDLYHVQVQNTGTDNVTFRFFYDQTCDCAFKPIPLELEHGMVVFVSHLEKGEELKAVFPEPPVHTLRVTLAQRFGDGADWPDAFRSLLVSAGTSGTDEYGRGLHEMTWKATFTGPHYFFVEATESRPELFDPRDPNALLLVGVVPTFESSGDPGNEKGSPGVALPVLLVGLLASVAFALRRRSV